MAIDIEVKKDIIGALEKIINIDNKSWNVLDINLKTKVIHHFCNLIEKNCNKNICKYNISNTNFNNEISIPLKSIKSKKLIQYTGINKNFNNNIYNLYNEEILNYTFDFRNKFNNKKSDKIYYTFSSMPKKTRESIINEYNNINYSFIKKNINLVSCTKLYQNLIGNNTDKIIVTNLPKKFDLEIDSNKLIIKFDNNICIFFELYLISDKITNNIPVKYMIKLVNLF